MCNFSEGVWERAMEKGMEKGLEKGIKKGFEKGEFQTTVNCLLNLMQSTHITIHEAMDMLGVSDHIRPQVLDAINEIETK